LGLADDDELLATEELETEEYGENESDSPIQSQSRRGTVVSLHTQKHLRLVLSEPERYDDSQIIADHLRSRRPVVVNLHRLSHEQAVRVIDFLSGTVYAIAGSMQKIGSNIFLCAPDNIDVQGTISDLLAKEGKFQSR